MNDTWGNKIEPENLSLIKRWLRNTVDNEIENVLNVDKSEVDEVTSNVSKCINEPFDKVKKEGLEQGIEKGKK